MTQPALPRIGFIGAGRVAQALARALQRAGWPVVALAGRSPQAPQRLADWLAAQPGGAASLVSDPQALLDQVDLVFLTVPDDTLSTASAALHWRPGLAVVHCSGATEVAALDAARVQGAQTGGFHPLQIFSDPVRAVDLLAGSTVAIEADEPLRTTLLALAATLGMRPITLPPGMRARYHAAAGYAASFLLPALAEAVALWRSFGVAEADALPALLPLARGTLDAVAQRGVAGALSGPISRGDTGVIARHLADLASLGPEHAAFYRELARRQLALAEAGGRLDVQVLQRLAQLLG